MQEYYSLLHCDLIEIHAVTVGHAQKRLYECVMNEEGRFIPENRISAIDHRMNPLFVGSIVITGTADEEGELTSLTDEDIEYLEKYVVEVVTLNHPEGSVVLAEVEM